MLHHMPYQITPYIIPSLNIISCRTNKAISLTAELTGNVVFRADVVSHVEGRALVCLHCDVTVCTQNRNNPALVLLAAAIQGERVTTAVFYMI